MILRGRHNGTYTPPVPLVHISQQVEMLGPEDDWTGLSSAAERRRLQNRLNQRAYRRRKKVQSQRNHSSEAAPPNSSSKSKLWHGYDCTAGGATEGCRLRAESEPTNQTIEWTCAVKYAAPNLQLDSPKINRPAGCCNSNLADIQKISTHFQECASNNYMLGSPKADHLLTLVKFNVFRAMMRNFFTLGLTMECMHDEAVSPFSTMNPGRLDPSVPQSLRPTVLQRTIPHHPWLDMFPIPTMRDNLVRAGDLFDDEQLCIDIMKYCGASPERTGLIVWGDPWDPYGWEVTEAFVKNWGWVIKGCHEIFESTNYWRAQRGEEALYFSLL